MTDLATLEPQPLRNWSHSSVKKMLDECGYQWYLTKILKLPESTHPRAPSGTAYHAAIEAHEEPRRLWWYSGGAIGSKDGVSYDEQMEAALEELDRELEEGSEVAWTEDLTCRADLVVEIETALTHWWEAPIPKGQPGEGGSLRDRVLPWRPVVVERRFRYYPDRWFPRPVLGSPDVIYLDPTGDEPELVGVDEKSAGHFKKYPLGGEGLRDQAAAYVIAARQAPNMPALGIPMRRFEYHVSRVEQGTNANFQSVRVVALEVDWQDETFVRQRLNLAEDRYAAGEFRKNPGWHLCSPKWCDFHKDAGGPCDPES